MKIAIAVTEAGPGARVSGHAGQARHWLLYDCEPGQPLPTGQGLALDKAQLPHYFRDNGPHPLRGVEILIAASAGDGFLRHMAGWGAQVLLTGESDPPSALRCVLAGQALPDTRFDLTTTLCKLRDLFSRH